MEFLLHVNMHVRIIMDGLAVFEWTLKVDLLIFIEGTACSPIYTFDIFNKYN